MCLWLSEFAPDDPDPERLLQQQARQASAESGQRSFQDRSRGGRRLSPPLEQTDRDARRDADPHHDDHAAAAPPRLWTDHDRLPHATSPDGWGGPHRDHPPAPDRGQYAEDRGHGGDGQYVTWEEVGAAGEGAAHGAGSAGPALTALRKSDLLTFAPLQIRRRHH